MGASDLAMAESKMDRLVRTFRKRAIPILWRLLPQAGCSGAEEQKRLLRQVAKLLPKARSGPN